MMRKILAALTVVLLTGCGTTKPEATASPGPSFKPPGSNCPGAVIESEQVRFGKDSALAGALIGTGKTGLILSPSVDLEAGTAVTAFLKANLKP